DEAGRIRDGRRRGSGVEKDSRCIRSQPLAQGRSGQGTRSEPHHTLEKDAGAEAGLTRRRRRTSSLYVAVFTDFRARCLASLRMTMLRSGREELAQGGGKGNSWVEHPASDSGEYTLRLGGREIAIAPVNYGKHRPSGRIPPSRSTLCGDERSAD